MARQDTRFTMEVERQTGSRKEARLDAEQTRSKAEYLPG